MLPSEITVFLAIVAVLAVIANFVPWFVAKVRGHHQSMAIFMLCLFLGWTGLGWVLALVWACTHVERTD